jgi:hypothetical protein
MNDKQNAKLNMAQRVSDTLAAHEAVYSGVVPMVSAVAELNGEIADIRTTATEQSMLNVSAATQKKREAENRMINSCVKIANTLYVIGFTTDNKDLTNLLGLSPYSFYRLEDNGKLALAKQIYAYAQEHVTELGAYGSDAAAVAAIGEEIAAYQAVISKPMDTIGEHKQKTTNLQTLFASLDSTLYDKLDKLIVLFKESNPDFYGEYRTARNYINTSSRQKKTT